MLLIAMQTAPTMHANSGNPLFDDFLVDVDHVIPLVGAGRQNDGCEKKQAPSGG